MQMYNAMLNDANTVKPSFYPHLSYALHKNTSDRSISKTLDVFMDIANFT